MNYNRLRETSAAVVGRSKTLLFWDLEMANCVKTNIRVENVQACDIKEVSDGCCTGNYEVDLIVGERSLTVDGWVVCGWLAPGANCDLDGSGLANWGSSQRGGWAVCDGDGQMSGRPQADESGEYSDPISVGNSCGNHVEVTPDMVPEWAAAVAIVDSIDSEADEDGYESAIEAAEAIRSEVVAAINDALRDYDTDCPEPDAETIYDDLSEIDGLEAFPIRFGDFRGAGAVLAWKDGDEFQFDFHPSSVDSDLAKLVGKMAVQVIEDAIAPDSDDDSDDDYGYDD